jgi:hypothetical protein
VEINEAFASQALACVRELGIKPEVLNLDGGGMAIGHPLGATGARITGKAASLLKRTGGRYALAAHASAAARASPPSWRRFKVATSMQLRPARLARCSAVSRRSSTVAAPSSAPTCVTPRLMLTVAPNRRPAGPPR